MNDIKVLNKAADNIRILAASAVEKAKSGHPGGAMGGADFINVLYSEYLQYDPKNPEWAGRDRFFLDPGHMAPMLYSQLCLTGKFSLEELAQLRQWGSPTTGHPEFEIARGIENTSGPLGQGHAYAIGAAIAAKFLAAHTGNPTFEKELTSATVAFRKKSPRAQLVSQVCLVLTTSLCSTIQTTSSCQLRQRKL